MIVQDRSENGGSCSDSLTAETCKASLTVNSPQLNDKLASVNDYCLKVRKPYTITKQREKWTEEEHNKFLEALKLYGRAWRRIEEHVGTKTAVQIRSHAQKFFSKIVRESKGSNSNSIDLIEIPPPRPKRKPTHPYPRKMVNPVNIDRQQWRQSQRSCSPNLSMSEQENQSPTSVLSAFNSDAFGSGDSNTPNCSLSPVSNATAPDPVDFRSSEVNTLPMGTELPSVIEENDNPASYLRVAEDQKLNLFPEVLGNPESSINKERDIRSIKLFGRIVIIT